jgi:hypothetical protein
MLARGFVIPTKIATGDSSYQWRAVVNAAKTKS